MNKVILWVVLLPFSALSAQALWQHGYIGLWQQGFVSVGSMQLLADLVIMCSLGMVWMWRNAQQTQRNVWPYLLLTLAAGSFGPLLYLLLAPCTTTQHLQGEKA